MDYLEIKQPPMFIQYKDKDGDIININTNHIGIYAKIGSENRIFLKNQTHAILTDKQADKLNAILKDFTISLED